MTAFRLFPTLLGAAVLAAPTISSADTPPSPARCFASLAQTHNGTLGLPLHAEPAIGHHDQVYFLRSGPRDTSLRLYRYDVARRETTPLSTSASDTPLSVEEKARRERARQTMTGITDFQQSDDGRFILASQGGALLRIDPDTGRSVQLPGQWLAPRLSPNGKFVAAVRDDDLYVLDATSGKARRLTTGGTPDITHGLAEFAAAEELQRHDGTWWSPDSSTLLYEDADSRNVEKHYIANPQSPQTPPTEFRYPRAGTPNATVNLKLVSAAGGPARPVMWDQDTFPYLGRVVWRKDGGLFLVVLSRGQTEEKLLSIDPATGASHDVLADRDPAWLDLTPIERSGGLSLPYALPDGDFLWAAQRGPQWQLERHHHDGSLAQILTTPDRPFLALLDVDGSHAIIEHQSGRIDNAISSVDLTTGALTSVAREKGLHTPHFASGRHDLFIDTLNGADGMRHTLVRDLDGAVRGDLPSLAEPIPFAIHATFTTAGPRQLDAAIIRPEGFHAERRYPVVLSVYAGPGFKQVNDAPASYADDQCLANQGFVVVSLDGRGTPGRNHDFERATKNDLIDLPLQDQIEGLRALGARYREMDMSRIGVFGWSFGGYFTAMATIRRPDVFKVGVAGAPPVDFADYDTAYTERYLGTPQQDAEGYRKSNVLTYASQLERPLLIMHGITDDNVYFENSMKLTQALLRTVRHYDLLLLPGTHMLSDPVLKANVAQVRAAYLGSALHP